MPNPKQQAACMQACHKEFSDDVVSANKLHSALVISATAAYLGTLAQLVPVATLGGSAGIVAAAIAHSEAIKAANENHTQNLDAAAEELQGCLAYC